MLSSSIILILFLRVIINCEGQKGFTIKFTNFICDPNPAYLKNVKCEIKAINWKRNAIFGSAFTVQPIKKIVGHIQFFKRYSGYRPFLFNFTSTDLCSFFKGVYKIPILKAVGPMIKKYTNLNHNCPFEGFLYARNFQADVLDFKSSIWPNGKYKIDVKLYSDNFVTKIIYLTYFFYVAED